MVNFYISAPVSAAFVEGGSVESCVLLELIFRCILLRSFGTSQALLNRLLELTAEILFKQISLGAFDNLLVRLYCVVGRLKFLLLALDGDGSVQVSLRGNLGRHQALREDSRRIGLIHHTTAMIGLMSTDKSGARH